MFNYKTNIYEGMSWHVCVFNDMFDDYAYVFDFCALLHTLAQTLIYLWIFQHICVYLCKFALILKRCAAQFAAE